MVPCQCQACCCSNRTAVVTCAHANWPAFAPVVITFVTCTVGVRSIPQKHFVRYCQEDCNMIGFPNARLLSLAQMQSHGGSVQISEGQVCHHTIAFCRAASALYNWKRKVPPENDILLTWWIGVVSPVTLRSHVNEGETNSPLEVDGRSFNKAKAWQDQCVPSTGLMVKVGIDLSEGLCWIKTGAD